MTPEELQTYINHITGPTSEQSICLQELIKKSRTSEKGLGVNYSISELKNAFKDLEGSITYKRKISDNTFLFLSEILTEIILSKES